MLMELCRILMVVSLMMLSCLTINAQVAKKQPALYHQLSQMLSKQPDYQADRVIESYGLKLQFKYAQKKDMARQEYILGDDYKMIAIIDLSEKNFIVIDPQQKTYFQETIENLDHFGEEAQVLPFPIMVLDTFVNGSKSLLPNRDSKILLTHQQSISGYAVKAFAIDSDGYNCNLYFADKLSNLLVRMEARDRDNFNYSDTLSNVELTVSRELFVIPKGYKQVELETLNSTIPPAVLEKEGQKRQAVLSK